MGLKYSLEKEFKKKNERNWNFIYFAIDLHDTVFESNYSNDIIPNKMYNYCKEVLQFLSNRADVKLILYTSSQPSHIEKYLQILNENGIKFDYINCNEDVKDNGFSCYKQKFYFNILIDDKAGFNPFEDWYELGKYLNIF